MRLAARRDATEPAIIEALRAAGWSVQQLSAPGVPDLLIGKGDRLMLLEVKSPGGKLTKDQVTWHAAWKGPTPSIVTNPAEALRAVKVDNG